jgi:hypothetical protein
MSWPRSNLPQTPCSLQVGHYGNRRNPPPVGDIITQPDGFAPAETHPAARCRSHPINREAQSAPVCPECRDRDGTAMMLIIVCPFFSMLGFIPSYLGDSKTQPPPFRFLACFAPPLSSNPLSRPGLSARSSRQSASDVEPYGGQKFAGFSGRLLPLLQEMFHPFEKIRRKHIRAGQLKLSY